MLEVYPLSSFTFNKIIDERSGLTFYGGYIPIFIVTLITFMKLSRERKVSYKKTIALLIIFFHLGYAIGRLGCHFSADGCYGKFTMLPVGMRYTWGLRPTLFPVHPTPLYESVINVCLFVYFLFLFVKNKTYDTIIFLSFLLFPLSRFLIEFIRNNAIVKWGLTLNQFISIALVIIQFLFFLIIRNYSDEKNTLNNNNYNSIAI